MHSLAQLYGRLGAERSWANTDNRTARTRPARAKSPGSVEYWLERLPSNFDDATDDQRRAAAEKAKKAYFTELAIKSAKARRAGGDAA